MPFPTVAPFAIVDSTKFTSSSTPSSQGISLIPPPPYGTIFEDVGYNKELGLGQSLYTHQYCGILMEVGITVLLYLIKLNFCGKPEPVLALHYIENSGQERCHIGFMKAHLTRHRHYDGVYGRDIKMQCGQKFHHNRGLAMLKSSQPLYQTSLQSLISLHSQNLHQQKK